MKSPVFKDLISYHLQYLDNRSKHSGNINISKRTLSKLSNTMRFLLMNSIYYSFSLKTFPPHVRWHHTHRFSSYKYHLSFCVYLSFWSLNQKIAQSLKLNLFYFYIYSLGNTIWLSTSYFLPTSFLWILDEHMYLPISLHGSLTDSSQCLVSEKSATTCI